MEPAAGARYKTIAADVHAQADVERPRGRTRHRDQSDGGDGDSDVPQGTG
jgi:hypothetical protein